MKIEKYHKFYIQRRITLLAVLGQMLLAAKYLVTGKWLFAESTIRRLPVYLQLWLHCRFGLKGQVWKSAWPTVQMLQTRKSRWRRIYRKIGISKRDLSRFTTVNPNSPKAIDHLIAMGLSSKQAHKAIQQIH